jgi:hypothetical protein
VWIHDIVKALQENKKIFIYYPYREGSKKMNISMEGLQNILEDKTKKKGMIYHGKVSGEQSKTLYNVNCVWKQLDFIITNNKITVGVNYDVEDEEYMFDEVFIAVAGFNKPRDIAQVSRRPRYLKSNRINIAFFDGFNKNTDFENDDLLVEYCSVYKALVQNLVKERQAPLKDALFFFCKKAGYNIEFDGRFLGKEVEEQLNVIFASGEHVYSYDNIPTIKHEKEFQEIQRRIFRSDNTLTDCLILDKYFFNLLFIETNDEEVISKMAFAWDKKYVKFFRHLQRIKFQRCVIHEIAKFNKWDALFPNNDTSLDNVKTNEIIREQISKEFHLSEE